MANRMFQQFQGAVLKNLVTLYAQVAIGATGACTLRKWDYAAKALANAPTATGTSPYQTGEAGIKSITRNTTGAYTIVLQDTYQRMVDFHGIFATVDGVQAAPIVTLWTTATDVTTSTGGVIKFSTSSAAGSNLADPTSGSVLYLTMVLSNASEP